MNYEDEATKENEKNSVCSVQNKANKVAKPSETTKRQCLDVCPHTHRARGRCRIPWLSVRVFGPQCGACNICNICFACHICTPRVETHK